MGVNPLSNCISIKERMIKQGGGEFVREGVLVLQLCIIIIVESFYTIFLEKSVARKVRYVCCV